MKIREFTVDSSISTELLVLSADIRYTNGSRKPYLDLKLSDGEDEISGKAWNWTAQNKPESDSVVNIEATVTIWNGMKQLTISKVTRSTTDPTTFAPKGDFDTEEYLIKLDELIDGITSIEVQQIVSEVFGKYKHELTTLPAGLKVHHAYHAGLLEHSVDTTTIAKAIAEQVPGCSVDLCVAGALLHDIGKIKVYGIDKAVINYLLPGSLTEHIVAGACMLEEFKTVDNLELIMLLQHMIASHHGSLEFGSAVTPKCIEAYIVSYSDLISSKANVINRINKGVTGKLTAREWSLDNSQMVSQEYIYGLLNS